MDQSDLREIESRVMQAMAHLVEGRCGVKMAQLVTECELFLQERCDFLGQYKQVMRNCEALLMSMATEVSYLKVKRNLEAGCAAKFSDEVIEQFRCWEVRPEFLEGVKPAEVKRVRQCRDLTAQKVVLYQCLS